ncbi:MAG: hypothetical protein ACK5OC_20955 [Pirellula sp.]
MTNSIPNSIQPSTSRLVSLDQFRGYTVAGMFLVNYFAHFTVCPQVLRHTHDYCSYADTIMPHFLFAVGFALRLTFGRRMQTQGSVSAYWRMFRRMLGLILVSLIVYQVGARAQNWQQLEDMGFWNAIKDPLKREWFQTLMHIAVTTLWILPVIHGKVLTRVYWLLFSAGAHVVLSYWFNFTWVNSPPSGIDGGPLGFLTWSIPALVGSFACDAFVNWNQPGKSVCQRIASMAAISFVLMLAGYAFSCGTRFYDVPVDKVEMYRSVKLARDPVWPLAVRVRDKLSNATLVDILAEPPFVKPPSHTERKWNYWMMSQRAGTLSYLVFAAGFSLLVYIVFFIVCDLWGLQLPFFRTLGTNALLGYVLHGMVSDAVQRFAPKDAPSWYAYGSLVLFFGINWLILRSFEKQGIFPRA